MIQDPMALMSPHHMLKIVGTPGRGYSLVYYMYLQPSVAAIEPENDFKHDCLDTRHNNHGWCVRQVLPGTWCQCFTYSTCTNSTSSNRDLDRRPSLTTACCTFTVNPVSFFCLLLVASSGRSQLIAHENDRSEAHCLPPAQPEPTSDLQWLVLLLQRRLLVAVQQDLQLVAMRCSAELLLAPSQVQAQAQQQQVLSTAQPACLRLLEHEMQQQHEGGPQATQADLHTSLCQMRLKVV